MKLGTQVEVQEENSNCKKRENPSRVLTGDMGGSYFLTKMDASRQGYAIPPCRFSRRALYPLPQMSSNIKKYEQPSISSIDIYPIQKYVCSDIPYQ
jgi:hypothetical protein